MTDIILKAEHLKKVFISGKKSMTAVDDVSFGLERGECLGIVGESGSGKSTIARMLTHLEPVTDGQIFLKGKDITHARGKTLRDIYQDIQMVFQMPMESFDPRRTLGDKEVASVNDGNFVSENQTDFIFAVAGEEYGFMGCCSIVILLLAISVECIRMSLRAKDLSGKIICCGMASIISLQSFLNICVATGIAPNTGTPLPFVSYGLTSLISLYIGMGMVLNVGLQSSAYNKEIRRKAIDQKEDYL